MKEQEKKVFHFTIHQLCEKLVIQVGENEVVNTPEILKKQVENTVLASLMDIVNNASKQEISIQIQKAQTTEDSIKELEAKEYK